MCRARSGSRSRACLVRTADATTCRSASGPGTQGPRSGRTGVRQQVVRKTPSAWRAPTLDHRIWNLLVRERTFGPWVLVAAGLMLFAAATMTRADADLWGHLRFGLDTIQARHLTSVDPYSFTQDTPWINHEW